MNKKELQITIRNFIFSSPSFVSNDFSHWPHCDFDNFLFKFNINKKKIQVSSRLLSRLRILRLLIVYIPKKL